MSDELREILDLLKRGIRAEKSMEIDTDNYIEDAIYDIEQLHKSERKKWALGLLPKEEPLNLGSNSSVQASQSGRNLTIAEIRKKIEGGGDDKERL